MNGTSYSGHQSLPILEKKEFLVLMTELADPVKKVAIPQHSPQSKLTKLYNYGQKYQNGLPKQIIANSKAHTLAIKLVL